MPAGLLGPEQVPSSRTLLSCNGRKYTPPQGQTRCPRVHLCVRDLTTSVHAGFMGSHTL